MSEQFKVVEPTAEEVFRYRETYQVSLHEAKSEIRKERMYSALYQVRESGTLEDKVNFLLDRFEESLDQ